MPELVLSAPDAFFESAGTRRRGLPGRPRRPAAPCQRLLRGAFRGQEVEPHSRKPAAGGREVLGVGRAGYRAALSDGFRPGLEERAVQPVPRYPGRAPAWKWPTMTRATSMAKRMSIADRALNSAIQSLAWKIDIEPEAGLVPVVVFNPHAWQAQIERRDRSQQDHRERGAAGRPGPGGAFQLVQSQATAGRQRLSFVADLPPLGYRLYRHGDPPGQGDFQGRRGQPDRAGKRALPPGVQTPRRATSPACAIKRRRWKCSSRTRPCRW